MNRAPDAPVVLDTTVLSNFAHVDSMELLADLPRICTVEVVLNEIRAGVDTHPYLERALVVLGADIPVLSPDNEVQALEQELLGVLDPGEAQVLALAEAASGTIITDDGDARKIAQEREISTTGSIGLLVRFVERDRLSPETADTYLKRWIDEAGFRSPARDFHVFLEAG